MAKLLRRSGLPASPSQGVRTGLLAICAFTALFIIRHIAMNSAKIQRLALSLRLCQEDTKALTQPELPDPFAAQTVYVPVACNDSQAPFERTAAPDTKPLSMRDLEEKLDQLHKSIKRKDEMLRVRNNQLVDAFATLENREALWNSSLHRINDMADSEPELLVAIAVLTDYDQIGLRDQFRKSWYADGSPAKLEQLLGVRVVFVVGSNPFALSDGTGLIHDSPEVRAEAAQHDDLLRVQSQHKAGSEGRSEVMHEVWRVLPLLYNAHFYSKVQGNALPSPMGFAQVLMQYDSSSAVYAGCMKSGPVVTDWKSPWYEPSNFKFGSSTSGDRNYMLHASANGYAISRPIALHLARFNDILAVYSNEDVMVGSWMLGLNVEHSYEGGFCCAHAERCKFSEDAIKDAATALQAYMGHGGKPAEGAQQQQRKGDTPAGCAAYGGGCNGVCGLRCTTDCSADKDWLQYQHCVRVV
eukprot:jgi/Ulvmu1/11078/UM007_0260.1